MSVNKAILVGHLGADPESRTTNSGAAVVNMRLATNERRKDRDGNWGDHTEWHSLVAFGKTAENCARFLSKGRQVYVEGRIQTRKWQDKEGRDRWSTEIVCDTVHFIGGKGEHDSGQSRGSYGGSPGGYGGSQGGDDIPF